MKLETIGLVGTALAIIVSLVSIYGAYYKKVKRDVDLDGLGARTNRQESTVHTLEGKVETLTQMVQSFVNSQGSINQQLGKHEQVAHRAEIDSREIKIKLDSILKSQHEMAVQIAKVETIISKHEDD